MPHLDLDNLLSELGVDGALRAPPPARPPSLAAPARPSAQPPAPVQPPVGGDTLTPAQPSPGPPRPRREANVPPSAPIVDTPAPPGPVMLPPASGAGPEGTPPSGVLPATDSLSAIYEPDAADLPAPRADIADLLLARNTITPQQLAAAHQIFKQSGGAGSGGSAGRRRLTDILIEQGADEAGIQQAVAELAGVPFERIDLDKGLDGGFDGTLLQRLTPDFCKQHLVVPLRVEAAGAWGEGRVVVGSTRPDDVFLLDEVRRRLGPAAASGLKLAVVTAFDIRGALEIIGETEAKDDNAEITRLLSEVEEGDVQVEKSQSKDEVDLEKEAGESPVIRYVNYIIQTAVKEGASDIHIEPAEKKLKVRFRIDGELFEMMNPPASMAAAITSRLKIMGNLDISERRVPQDGRIRCTVQGRKLDLRMSTLPTVGGGGGEKVVMRILDTRSINVDLDQLGFDENTLTIWKKQIDSPHGIILVTGPTGSGKTTTLYASLRGLDKNSMNISTVEDPVEYHLDGITQTQTHDKIGMTFAKALKALLRQDPDVIMLGEIRDMETAHTAVQAALTGHLVLSTLHTNDAPSSITRLVNIGLEPFLVGAAINAVLAQRLVRRLCLSCKQQARPTEERAEYLQMQGMDPDSVFIAKGCDKCRSTGYAGRVGIYELLTTDDQLRDIIARNPNVAEFRRLCIERGMTTLRDDGMRKVAKGLTTVEEILRVTEAAH